MSANILFIDAERTTLARTLPVLAREGYHVMHVPPGQAALDTVRATSPDLVILRVELQASGPGVGSWHFCRQIAACLTSPLLLLLPDHDEAARVKGLQLGADDCMACPVGLLELVARVRALLRRSRQRAVNHHAAHYVDGSLAIDLARARVSLDNNSIALTPAETCLLACLVEHAGQPVPIERLCTAVWGVEAPASTGRLRRIVRRLRQKIETDPHHPRRLVARRGQGYALVKAAEPTA
ncbi:MAG: response regulator transcription factor [Anaerolineae bacterium]|nr:response regulator transcription factor [Anaerolineae bacterium]